MLFIGNPHKMGSMRSGDFERQRNLVPMEKRHVACPA
jgi:hypothetical protein